MFNLMVTMKDEVFNLADDIFSKPVDVANYDNDEFKMMMDFLFKENNNIKSESDIDIDIAIFTGIEPVTEDILDNILYCLKCLENEVKFTLNGYSDILKTVSSYVEYTNTLNVYLSDKYNELERIVNNLVCFYEKIDETFFKVQKIGIDNFNW